MEKVKKALDSYREYKNEISILNSSMNSSRYEDTVEGTPRS